MKKIIYDLGAARGENLPYYLMKSELVIAIEASKESCNFIKKKFQTEITEKKLIVENCIISETNSINDGFYLNENYLLNQYPTPKKNRLNKFKKINLEKKDVANLFSTYGEPYYIKIDLEEYDNVILKRIFDLQIKPNYISAEAINDEVIKLFLSNINYNSFKLVEGNTVGFLYNKFNFKINDKIIKYSFPENSAGPFGNDIMGNWMSKKNFSKFMEYKKSGWRDIHASLLDPSEDTEDFIKYINIEKKMEKKAKLIRRYLRFISKFRFFKNDKNF
tara:strand:- start:5492 stop:6319 length:828 start_codon:yes stop_codon:yes gene_type:complete